MRFYVGTYSQRGSKGIYVGELNDTTGALTITGTVGGVDDPSFLALHPNGRFLYAVGEGKNGVVAAYALSGRQGMPRPLNYQSSRGDAPCHLAVDPSGQNLLVANYMSGSVAVLPIAPDGSLRPISGFVQHQGASHVNAGRQEAPHAHMIRVDPSGNYVVAADLGCDRVFVYRFDPIAGNLVPHDPPAIVTPPGSGPRHFAWTPDARSFYVIHELDATIGAYRYDARKGTFTQTQTISTLPPDWTGTKSCAELVVHPSGRFLYGSNRGHDSIAAFAIDKASGKLRRLGFTPSGGKIPRGFAIDPKGKWLVAANQDTDNLAAFRIDASTGALTPMGSGPSVPAPVCVLFA